MENEQEVKTGQRWMPKTKGNSFQEGRFIVAVQDGRYTALGGGGGPLEFLLGNFTLCHCAALHEGPCQSPAIAPAPASACEPWCGKTRLYPATACGVVHPESEDHCFGSPLWHFCSPDCAKKHRAKKAAPASINYSNSWPGRLTVTHYGASPYLPPDSPVTASDTAGASARAAIPDAIAGCRLGCSCKVHRPAKPAPYVPAIDDWDLLPDV